MKAYKVFNTDWTCRDQKYEVGKTYTMEANPIICRRGYHACLKLSDCFSYYNFDKNNKVAVVEIIGDVDRCNNDSKICTNKIKIVKELSWNEVLFFANEGVCNTGHSNSGHRNSGHSNSGNWNSGDRNSGHSNSGNWNSGDWNSGNWNSGDWNSGNWNSGDWNSGDNFSGSFNTNKFKNRKRELFNKLVTAKEYEKFLSSKGLSILNRYFSTPRKGKCFYSNCRFMWYQKLTSKQRLEVIRIPHFDKSIFEEITGINIPNLKRFKNV